MLTIKKIAVLGANGNMGSLSGGIFAQAGIQCYYFARTQEKAQKGKEKAIAQARSIVLDSLISAHSYDELEKIIPECDWIFEGLGENLNLKKDFYKKIDLLRKPDSIVSTVSSGLSITEMVEETSENLQSFFMGTHFYNPPGKLIANELIFHPKNSQELKKDIECFCDSVLRRVNIITHNTPAFAGNRVGFHFLNEVAISAIKQGVEKMDYLLGSYTGRAMPPLSTIDLVGFDVHQAIVDNIYEKINDERHEALKLPSYMLKMIENGQIGWKTPAKGGFFFRTPDKKKKVLDIATLEYKDLQNIKVDFVEQMKLFIRDGYYQKAINILKSTDNSDADLVRYFISSYLSYSFSRVAEITPEKDFIYGIDRVMSSGFSWMPPSAWVDLLGGPKATTDFIKSVSVPLSIPSALENAKEAPMCRLVEYTRFLSGR